MELKIKIDVVVVTVRHPGQPGYAIKMKVEGQQWDFVYQEGQFHYEKRLKTKPVGEPFHWVEATYVLDIDPISATVSLEARDITSSFSGAQVEIDDIETDLYYTHQKTA